MCPQSAATNRPGPCGCDMTDTDGDGVLDCVDECINDVSKTTAGLCGCNVADVDSDGDGIPDCYDSCPGQSDIANEGLAVQFNLPITGPGGEFRLCWCAAGFDCSSQSSFRVDFGVLKIFAPFPLEQHRTCVAGQTCQMDSLLGSGPSNIFNTHVSILNTCGMTSLQGLPQGGWLSSPNLTGNGAVLGFGSIRIAAKGGEYRLCWCSFNQDCSQPSQFRVDVGLFLLIGPSPLEQAWTCINGKTCNLLTLTGVGLGDYDMVAVMDTCLQNDIKRFPWAVLPTAASRSGASYELGVLTLTAGRYRLCWCATGTSCSTFEDFALDVGTLNLLGPTPVQQHRTCVAGQPCYFEHFESFGSADGLGTIWILNTCGEGISQERMPNTGLLVGRSPRPSAGCDAAAQDTDGDGIPNYLDQCPLHFYQNSTICGCGADETDSDSDGVPDCLDSCPWDASKVSPGQCDCGTSDTDSDGDGVPDCNDQCQSDASKTLPGLCGCGLLDVDADVDGVPDCYDKCTGSDQIAPSCGCSAANLDDDGDGTKNCFDSCPNDPGKVLPGVCGCGIADVDTDADGHMDCVDGCPLDAAKSLPGQCGCGVVDTDSDLDSIADCIDQCPTDVSKSLLGLCGCGISDADSDSDGIPDCYDNCLGFDLRPEVSESSYTFGDSVSSVSAAGGVYRLCWCAQDCREKEDFLVDAGTFELIGPSPLEQHRTCISGQVCRIGALKGHYLTAGDQLLVLDTCFGVDSNDHYDNDNSSIQRFRAEFARNGTEGHLGTLASDVLRLEGGTYRLCWCAGSTFDCFGSFVDVGSLSVVGPTSFTQHSTCIIGQVCTLSQISGYWFGQGDLLLLETCGVAVSLDINFPVFNIEDKTGDSTLFSNTFLGAQSAGEYRLCWCPNVTVRDRIDPESCGAEIGSLVLLGPRPLQQDRTCTVGKKCVMEGLTGLGLIGLSQSLLVLDTCGLEHSVLTQNSVWSQSGASFVSHLDAPGGSYRLCWCSSRCEEISDFAVDMGQLQMIGPTRIGRQHRTCIAGQRCSFSIEGWFLETSDVYVMLETCGASVASHVPRSPDSGQFGTDSLLDATFSPLSFARISLSGILTSAGGIYRLCWCGSFGCSDSGFDVDVGQLQVIGPSHDQHRTCVAGQSCLLNAFIGSALFTDAYYIMDTCGVPSVPSGFGGVRSADVNSSLSGRSEVTGVTVTWHERISAVGGTYRICWCAAGQVCSTAEDFAVDMGTLDFIGPHRLDNVATCMSGSACVITSVSGNHLSGQDAAVLLNTCGYSETIPGLNSFPREGSPGNSGLVGARLQLSANSVMTAGGGEYRLCWCAGGFACELASHFTIDMGKLHLIGPELDQDRTCVTGRDQSVDWSNDTSYTRHKRHTMPTRETEDIHKIRKTYKTYTRHTQDIKYIPCLQEKLKTYTRYARHTRHTQDIHKT